MNLTNAIRENLNLVKNEWKNYADPNAYDFCILENENICVSICSYGLRIVNLWVNSNENQPIDIIVGPALPNHFFQSTNPYYGAIIGPFANRIANGKFDIENHTYQLECNNLPNHLHGGTNGFHTQNWKLLKQEKNRLWWKHISKPEHQGYPATVEITVCFTLLENGLKIDYEATTNEPTILNLTHHPFFNLNGVGVGSIEKHQIQLNSQHYLPINEVCIPLGNYEKVNESPFDFTSLTSIEQQIHIPNEQLKRGNGFDHCFVLNTTPTNELQLAATAVGNQSKIKMEIYTTEPGIQFYTGNFMDGINTMKDGSKDEVRFAFCLETQHFPDSPNQPQFPSTLITPNQKFVTTTAFHFT